MRVSNSGARAASRRCDALLARVAPLLVLSTIAAACAPGIPEVGEPRPRPRAEPAPRPAIDLGATTGDQTVGIDAGSLPRVEVPPPAPEPRPLETVTGVASYYSDRLHNRITASGIPYDKNALVAAHRTYPFGTVLRVTNLANDRVVTVRVVDRGPFIKGRILDLSRRAAEELDFITAGLTEVLIEVLEYGGR